MSSRADLRRAAPWVLCAVSLGMLVLGSVLRWPARDQATTGDVAWLEGVVGALGFAGIPVVGALIASRLPANPYGWLWCAAGLAYAVSDIARPLARVLDWPAWTAWTVGAFGFVSLIGLLIFVFLLFPDGRLPTPRWRWFARAAVAGSLLLVLAVPFLPDPDDLAAAAPWALRGERSPLRLPRRVGSCTRCLASSW